MFKTLFTAFLAMVAASAVARAEESVTFASWGGSFQKAERAAFLTPAEKALGIVIKEDTTNGIADVRAQVQSGSPTWDIAELGSNSCAQAKEEGLIEPLDYNVINTKGLAPGLVDSHWVGILYYATVFGWSTEKFGDKGPRNWADFWDAKKFPGARAIYAKPYYNLESAMLAAGKKPSEVYPIDIELGFDMLKKLKPSVSVFWKSGAQSAQLMKDGEVDMISIWNGRIGNAIKDGAKADFTFNQQILDFDCLIIPKGAKNKDLAMKAINEFLKAENQAELPFHINYGPINDNAFDVPNKITAEMAANLPSAPENRKKAVIFNPNWWVGRMNELQERYDLLIQE